MTGSTQENQILLVEDNPMDVELTLRAFAKRNLINKINVARDGEEAMAWVARWRAGEPKPLVVLLDLKLPKINGLEVLRQIKSDPSLRSIPVVALTSSSADKDIETAYELGVNSYIMKPVNFDKFMEVAHQIELYWCLLNHHPGSSK